MAAHIRTLSSSIVQRAALESFVKLDPRVQWRNPVMFVVWVGSLLVTLIWLAGTGKESSGFVLAVALWLWFTIVFANFAESVAGGARIGRRPLRGDRRNTRAVRLAGRAHHGEPGRDFPGPHDRAGRRRQALAHAQRDRALHPARQVHADLSVRLRDPAAVLGV